MKTLLKLIALALIMATGLHAGLTDTAKPCLDNAIVGPQLMDQFEQYKSVRDQVIAIQKGEQKATQDQLINLVEQEVETAVKSYARAECALYLGDLRAEAGDTLGARDAYKVSAYYAKKAVQFTNDPDPAKVKKSQDVGEEFLALARQRMSELDSK